MAASLAPIVSLFAVTVALRASFSVRRVSFSSVSNAFARFSVSKRDLSAAFSDSCASIKIREARSSSTAALHADASFSCRLRSASCLLARVPDFGELSADFVGGGGGCADAASTLNITTSIAGSSFDRFKFFILFPRERLQLG